LAGPIRRACPWANECLREALPELEPLFDQHYDRVVRESLCLLYVAMTRAKLGLFMMMDRPSKKHVESGEISRADHLLRMTLAPDVEPELGAMLHRTGDPAAVLAHGRDEAAGREPAPAPAGADDDDARPQLRAAASDGDGPTFRSRGGAARPASQTLDDGDHAAALDRLRLLNDGAIDRGTAVHALFEAIEWLDNGNAETSTLDDASLLERLKAIAPRRPDDWRRETVSLFRQSLASPEVAAALTKPAVPAGHTLHVAHELPYARSEDGRIQRGYIDRLVVERDERGAAVLAEIVDFKTDAVGPDDEAALAQAAKHHRPQLEAYRTVVGALHRLAGDAIAMRLVFVRPGRVVTLER
jgi:ATP-dependent exoDNAse (exonuclease V) beta subunit